jgi:metal iron transporter
MNCPVRTDPAPDEGHNQNPPELAPELTTRRTLNPKKSQTGIRIDLVDGSHAPAEEEPGDPNEIKSTDEEGANGGRQSEATGCMQKGLRFWGGGDGANSGGGKRRFVNAAIKAREVVKKYVKFIGPGFMVSVAYIDPGKKIRKERFCQAVADVLIQETMPPMLLPEPHIAIGCYSSF